MLDSFSANWKSYLLVLLIVALAVFITTMDSPLPEHLTKFDFKAYWSASRLLANSENFSDPALLLQIQNQLTDSSDEEVLMTWNPPWLLAWLLPYTALSFDRASWLWFLTNIVFIYISVVMLWRIFTQETPSQRKIWIPLCLALIYIPTLTTMLVGQITSLVLLGLTGFIFFYKRQNFFVSGVFLALTTVKPQLVFITLAIVLLELAWRRRWSAFAGFLVPLAVGNIVALIFRPTFVYDYIDFMVGSTVTQWATPTISYLLLDMSGISQARFIGLAIIPLAVVWWYVRSKSQVFKMEDLVISTLLLSMLFSPFAWSFDAILLLIPLTQLIAWAVEGYLNPRATLILLAVFAVANVVALYQRTLEVQDWVFLWFPLVMMVLYAGGWWLSTQEQSSGART